MARRLHRTARKLARVSAERAAFRLASRECSSDVAGYCAGGSCISCRASECSTKSSRRSFGLFLANRLGGGDLRSPCSNLRQRGESACLFPTALWSVADLDLDSVLGCGGGRSRRLPY